MALKKTGFIPALQRNYDKVLVVVVLVGLLVALMFLGFSANKRRADSRSFEKTLGEQRPDFPVVRPKDPTPFKRALDQIDHPFQMADATNKKFFVSQELVWCVECRQPIPFDVDKCPKCGTKQPGAINMDDWDTDGDGIPDGEERRLGLNPLDPADAGLDADGDGFTNHEEFLAKTDMHDATSHPPRISFLRIDDISEVPFHLVLKSSMNTGKSIRYQIDDAISRQTYWVTNGGAVGKTGFAITEEKSKTEKRVIPGSTVPKNVVVRSITVTKGPVSITLEEGAPRASSDYLVKFICEKDSEPIQYAASRGEKLVFDNESYEVINIDRTKGYVVIKSVSNGESFKVGRK